MNKRKFKVNKFNARKAEVDGIEFDSQAEARRYEKLKKMLDDGYISDLRMQVRYELIPTIREPDSVGPRGGVIRGKTIERGVDYVADFVYVRDGREIVEDVKGYRDTGSATYKVFIIKRKLMRWRYGIEVMEVRA